MHRLSQVQGDQAPPGLQAFDHKSLAPREQFADQTSDFLARKGDSRIALNPASYWVIEVEAHSVRIDYHWLSRLRVGC